MASYRSTITREQILSLSAPGESNTRDGLGYMEDSSARGTDNNARDNAAAGITYLGQLISHDMSRFDPADFSNPDRSPPNPDSLRNRVTPTLDLDTIYGDAENQHPVDPSNNAKLLMGNRENPNDWPRNDNGEATIADDRNDEHMIITQLAALFPRMHNRIVDYLDADAKMSRWSHSRKFTFAQEAVIQHWQSIILTDWLPLVVTSDILADVSNNGNRWYKGQAVARGKIPLEFVVGSHRLGHSIGRGRYALNGLQIESDGAPKRFRIFPLDAVEALPENNLLGNRFVTNNFEIEWNRFFNFSSSSLGDIASDVSQFAGLQVYRRIDRLYARPLMRLPVRGNIGLPANPIGGTSNEVDSVPVISLATLDLLRGKAVKMPCGIQQAKELEEQGMLNKGVLPLEAFDLFKPRGEDGAALPPGSMSDVPFLLYILQEGRTQNAGERLGELGGRIEAEVIYAMLERTEPSILRGKTWKSPITCSNSFSMVDLIQFVEGDLDFGSC